MIHMEYYLIVSAIMFFAGAGQGARKQRNVVHEGCGKAMRSMESVQNKLLL